MGSDQDIDIAAGGSLQHLALLLARQEATESLHLDRPFSHPFAKGDQMLLRQHRGRYQYSNLLTVPRHLEGRPHGEFGLAVTDISANQSIHRLGLFHVLLDDTDGLELVARFFERKRILESMLGFIVLRKRVPGTFCPQCLNLEQLGCQIVECFLGAGLFLRPCAATDPVEPARFFPTADKLLDHIDSFNRDQ